MIMRADENEDSAGFAELLPDSVYALGVLFVVGLGGFCLWVWLR